MSHFSYEDPANRMAADLLPQNREWTPEFRAGVVAGLRWCAANRDAWSTFALEADRIERADKPCP